MIKYVIIITMSLFIPVASVNPPLETFIGYPGITNYSAREYGQHEQNWAACQDTNGIMYFGNTHGLLEYDGSDWIMHSTTSPDIVRSLAISKKNRIYTGGFNYFGFLGKDSLGNTVYRPLSNQLKSEYETFGNVWNINIINDMVFFQTDSALFRWDGDSFHHWQTTYPLNRSFVVRDTLYLSRKGIGLGYLDGDSFILMPGGELFADEKIYSIIPGGQDSLLIASRNKGLFIVKGGTVKRFVTGFEQEIIDKQVTSMAVLFNGDIVIGTRYGGIMVFGKDGRLKHRIDNKSGLNDNTVWNLYPDNQGNLWVLMNNGIARITLPSAITRFNLQNGLEGTVESIARIGSKIYFATPQGLFYKDGKTHLLHLSRINDFKPWKMISHGAKLVVLGYDEGIWLLDRNRLRRVFDYSGYCLKRSILDTNRIFIGLDNGLASIYNKNGEWIDEGMIDMQISPVRDIIELDSGDLWLGASSSEVYRLLLTDKPEQLSMAKFLTYGKDQGVMPSKQTYVFSNGRDILLGNNDQILVYDESQDRFIPAAPVNRLLGNKARSIHELVTGQHGSLWMYGISKRGSFVGAAGLSEEKHWEWILNPQNPLSGEMFITIYPDPEEQNIIWLGGPDGVVRYDKNAAQSVRDPYPCLIRRVRMKNDSLYWSHNTSVMGQKRHIDSQHPVTYDLNRLRFEFTAPFYERPSDIRFRYMLQGFDKGWSHWTPERDVNYTNIPEGIYIFRVKARNIYGTESREASFTFSVLAPWYRTWPMYLFYVLAFVTVIYAAVRFRLRAMQSEKKRLERIVRERTEEIRLKNRQLEAQAEQLKALDKTKSRFFADVSHEFRTPLTLIKGPAEGLLKNNYKGNPEKGLKLILDNTDRLLHLINQLLDISKLESGSMKLAASLQPLSPFISVIKNFFSSLAESKKIKLQFIKPEEEIELYFDQDMLEKILCNLLSNAFKFTPDHGFITISLRKMAKTSENYPEGAALISVHDSGKGIPEEELQTIFKRFEQGVHSKNHELTGSGIGLALTKELVSMHHGDIRVETALNEGTKFDICLPLGKAHLNPDEISAAKNASEDRYEHNIYVEEYEDKADQTSGNNVSVKNTAPCQVLIVEDNEEVRTYIREHLEQDFQISEAGDGKQGETSAIELLPDLIISDVMMPEMDGVEMTQRLKQNPLTNHIPVILLTAKASDEARIEGLETGADAYMAKPFNAQELLIRSKKLIEGRRQLREKYKKEFLINPPDSQPESIEDSFLKKLHGTIHQHFSDPDFGAERLSSEFSLSRRQFHRKIQAITGHTPGQLIRIMRLNKARQLIEKKSGNISEIAFAVGFNNLSYFSKCFSEQFGILPSEMG